MNRDERQGIWIFMCVIVLLIPLTYAEDFQESLKKHVDEVISLDEHLRSLNEPVEWYRSVSKRSDCGAVCGLPPPLDLKANCTKRQWVPNYEEKNGCECLTEYKCCDDQCPMADLTSCWRNGKKGQQFGIMEIDCCGCNVTKCVQCPPTLTRSELCPKTRKNLSKCYDYSNTETHENITGCFRATCEEKLSDAPADESCDPKCQKTTVKRTQCLFDYNKCEASKVISNCPLYLEKENFKLLKKPIKCFHNTPTKVDDVNGGYFEDSSSRLCKTCFKWNYSPKSCATKNSAAKLLSCHKHGAFQKDKKCFQKNISPDDCGCNSAQCVESSAPESDTFGKDDVCPLNTLKISGVSICMKARDICKRCAPLKELTPPSCSYGEVVQTYDSIGCKIYACKLATIPEVQCTSNKYELNKNTNKLTCLTGIPRGYREGKDGYFYKYYAKHENWNDAQDVCKAEGGNLAIIWDKTTLDSVRDFYDTYSWIGLTDKWQEGTWQTVYKGNVGYTNWAPNEPNDYGSGEDCAFLRTNKKWNDYSCKKKLPFVCQLLITRNFF